MIVKLLTSIGTFTELHLELRCFATIISQKTVEYFIKHKMLRKILPIDFTDDLNFLQGGWVSML